MPSADKTNLIDRLREYGDITEEQAHEVNIWQRGQTLRQVYGTLAWQELMLMLSNYRDDAIQRLMATDPKDKDEVAVEHAVAYAAARIVSNVQEDVLAAINAKKPQFISEWMRNAKSPAPIESL